MQLYPMPLEICCYNAGSAIAAAEAGADRIELCAGAFGGITPSAGTMDAVCRTVSIPVHVLIRPREGDFNYTSTEFETMLKDIEVCGQYNVAGLVFGILDPTGQVDVARCKALVAAAGKRSCVFHKAIDTTPDIEYALEQIIDCGFTAVLTSGGQRSVLEGLGHLTALLRNFGTTIQIMPGGGIRSANIAAIAAALQTEWYHSGAIIEKCPNQQMAMYDNAEIQRCDTGEIRAMQMQLQKNKS